MGLFAHYANICLRYIQMIKITDIIDMAIIAYIIYRLLLLTKKSRSGQVLEGHCPGTAGPGRGLLLPLCMCSTTSCGGPWIGFLALIVVFQPRDSPFSWNKWAAKGSVTVGPSDQDY